MRANAPQLPGGGMGAAGIDWCISLQVQHITCENKYQGLLFSGNFMCTFWSSFPVLTATVTKPNIQRKTKIQIIKISEGISCQEKLR